MNTTMVRAVMIHTYGSRAAPRASMNNERLAGFN
jgi:hypothetical protein